MSIDVFSDIQGIVEELIGEGDYYDEEPLDDLHLNNAINLDYIKVLLRREVPYRIVVPNYIQEDFQILCKKINIKEGSINLGFQELTTRVAAIGSAVMRMNFSVAREVCETIKSACDVYKLSIPISTLNTKTLGEIEIPEMWWNNFENVLSIVNGRSEIKRGSINTGKIPLVTSIGTTVLGNIVTSTKNYTVYSRGYISIISSNDDTDEEYISNIDGLLLMLDTLGQRICLWISNQICLVNKVPGAVPFEVLENIIDVGDLILRTTKNGGYDVIAMFESLCVSILIQKCPDDVNDKRLFYTSCMDEIKELEIPVHCKSHVLELVNIWTELLSSLPNNQISNIFCLYRIWGHPIVDIYRGMKKVHQLGKAKKFIPTRIQETTLYQFRKMFLISFFRKHKTYPDYKEINTDKSYIKDCLSECTLINTHDNRYQLSQFGGIKIGKIWEIPETYDIFHILNDKAVSPNKSELISSLKNNRGTQCGELRRGLWRWLKSDSFRCKELLQKINDHGLSENSLIIGLYEKEREIKINARMFALMSEEMRYYFVLTEEMIANYILKYFPEITMKDSLNVLLRKLWTHSKRSQDTQLDVNINIDFSKWNLNMRDDLVKLVFEEIDGMFGYTKLISRTHEIFTRSYIYSASGKYTPEIKNGELIEDPPMSYTGHIGGFEGLRQKGWTIVTVLILSYIADLHNIKISLMGQGDNQVVKVHMPRRKWTEFKMNQGARIEDARKIISEYIRGMDINFRAAQLPIKVRETWRSCTLFMYGKMMTVTSDTLPQWYKKILRSYALSNEGVLTFGGVIGTIASNLATSASTCTKPDIMYVVYLILAEWSCWSLLRYHPFTRSSYIVSPPRKVSLAEGKRKVTYYITSVSWENYIASILTVPTSVGGNITIPLTSFICRGFPDPVSEGYAWLKFLIFGDGKFTLLYKNWYSFIPNETAELDHLIQSPLAVNHKRPPTPEVQSREVVRNWLLSGQFKDNKFIKNVERIMKNFDRKRICEELVSNPCSPLICSELYQVLPQVALDSVLRRVENTRTIRRMALKSNTKVPVLKKLSEVEENFLAYICWRMESKGSTLSDCATEQARKARNLGWGKEIIHITTPHPFELLLGKRCRNMLPSCANEDHILAKININGDFAPYLGSKTKIKVHSGQDEYARREPLLTVSSRLARYTSWLSLGENTKKYIENAVKMTCDISIFDEFFSEDTEIETFSGSVEHRFQPTGMTEGSFINYAPQLGKKVFLSSDFLPKYGRGKTNYTLAFQPLFIILQYVAAHEINSSVIHFHIDCEKCLVKVEDVVPDIRSSTPGIMQALNPSRTDIIRETLGFINRKVELTILNKPEIIGQHVRIENQRLNIIEYSIYLTLSHVVSLGLRSHREVQSEGIGYEDLQAFPRIYSFKLYMDTLLEITASCLILQTLVKNSMSTSLENVGTCKRHIIKHLSTLPVEAFKEIGSLCVGRVLSTTGDISLISKGFPETVEMFLESIRSLLIGFVEGTIKISEIRTKVILPIEITTKRVHLYILTHMSIRYNCSLHISNISLEKCIKENSYFDCKNGCLQKSIKNVLLTNATLDRMFKRVAVIDKSLNFPQHPMQHIFRMTEIAIVTSSKYLGILKDDTLRRYLNRKKSIRVLSQPTSSLYKWEGIRLPPNIDTCVVFGDGTGGSSLAIATNHPEVRIYPCAKLEGGRCIPQDILSMTPSLSRHMKNVSNLLQIYLPDDIHDAQWKQRFCEFIKFQDPSTLSIVSDLETSQGNKNINTEIINCLLPGTCLYFKVYLHEFKTGGILSRVSFARLNICNFLNFEYGEIIISGVVDHTIRGAQETMLDEQIKKFLETQSPQISQYEIHKGLINKYPSVWRFNLIWAIEKMTGMGVPINLDILNLKMFEVIGYFHSYTRNNFYFGGNKIHDSSHLITPRKQDELTTEIKVLISIYLKSDLYINDISRIIVQPDSATKLPSIIFTNHCNRLAKTEQKLVEILKFHRRLQNLTELTTQNVKELIMKQTKYSENHRTYTWSLMKTGSSNISSSIADDFSLVIS